MKPEDLVVNRPYSTIAAPRLPAAPPTIIQFPRSDQPRALILPLLVGRHIAARISASRKTLNPQLGQLNPRASAVTRILSIRLPYEQPTRCVRCPESRRQQMNRMPP